MRGAYLQELESVRAAQVFEELDASNGVRGRVHGQQLRQEADG